MADDKKAKKDKKSSKEHDSSKYIELEPTMESTDAEDLDEAPLTLQQRRQRGRTMRRFSSKIKAAKDRASRKKASPEKLKQRARKKARALIRQRLMRNKSYSAMSPAEKLAIDKRLSKIPASTINRMAVKTLPTVRAAEVERIQKRGQSKKEDMDYKFSAFLESLEQDDATVITNDEKSKTQKKRFHQMFKKEGDINIDRRFKIYRPRESAFTEDFVSVVQAVEENWDMFENSDKPENREDGTDSLTKTFKKDTPGQDINEKFNNIFGENN